MRRMKGFTSLLVAAGLSLSAVLPAAAEDLHVWSAGGEYGDSLTNCVNPQVEEAGGFKIVMDSPGGYAKMQAQNRSGVITNVVTDASTGDLFRMKAEGIVEPIDWVKLDPEPMFDEAKNEFGFGASYYSTIMAWRSDAPAPSNWVEFFDTEKFPGTRALPDYPDFVLPFAAAGGGQDVESLAEGVDLDKAFATLKRISDDIIWWQSGAQPAQLLKDNEAQYAIAWSGRVIGHEGITSTFKGGMLDTSWWVVAKGISDSQRDMLYAWLKEQTKASVQKCLVEALPYPGPSPDLASLVTEDMAMAFPTYSANKDVQWLVPGQWWFENADEIEKQWNQFKLQ